MSRAVDLALAMPLPDGRTLRAASTGDAWIRSAILEPLLVERHANIWLEASRGSAKSTVVSYALLAQALVEAGLLVIFVAKDGDQAGLMVDALSSMLRQTPELSAAFAGQSRQEFRLTNGSALRVMSSDAGSAFGIGPGYRRVVVVCDELTQWRDRELYDALASALPKLQGSQIVVLCNAGILHSWQHELRKALAEVGAYIWAPPGASPASWLDTKALEVARRILPPLVFQRLHQNEWTPAGEQRIFREEWLNWYDEAPPEFKFKATSWDTAYSERSSADFSVGMTIGVGEDAYYLLNMARGRLEFPALKSLVVAEADRWTPGAVVVEDIGSGKSILQELQRGNRLPLVGRKPIADKQTRAYAVTPLFQAGRVLLPRNASWVSDLLAELLAFPGGGHDDCVDALTQGLSYLASMFNFDRPAGGFTLAMADVAGRSTPLRNMRPSLGVASSGGSSRFYRSGRALPDPRKADVVVEGPGVYGW